MVSLVKVIMWELCQRFFSSVFSICKVKGYIHGNVSFTNYASGIPDCSKLVVNRKNDNDVKICSHDVIIKFFDVILYLLSSLVTGPSFMSRSSLVLESWQFSSIGDWPEIRKSKIPPSEFCPISGDWSKLGIPNLARMALRKCYWILQNTRVTAFTVSKLLRENQQWGKISPPPPPSRIRLRHRPTKWSNTQKQFVGKGRKIVLVCFMMAHNCHGNNKKKHS